MYTCDMTCKSIIMSVEVTAVEIDRMMMYVGGVWRCGGVRVWRCRGVEV